MPNISHVLIFPCGSEIGLEHHRSLRYSPHFRLFGLSSVPDHGRFVYENYISTPHMVGDADFLLSLNKTLAAHLIDFILPAHDEALTCLSNWAASGLVDAEVVAPSREVCRICRSKRLTYETFAGHIPTPRLYEPAELDQAEYPLFLKPDAGQGSRGTMLAVDAAAAREKLRHSPGDLVLEYLPGPEYTVDCFTDRHGRLLFVSGRIRRRVTNGISVNSREVDDVPFREHAETINRSLAMRGAWFFQMKEDEDGRLKLLEIAPRIGGTSGIQRAKGVNLPLLSLYDRLDMDLEIIDNRLHHVEIDRALASLYRLHIEYDTVYMDLDDTLVIGNLVNPEAVKFLFQCRNRGARVVLLTRHFEDPATFLKDLRLDRLFDEVIWLDNDKGKSTAITSPKSIFIDDSFEERREVSQSLGIPVFDPSAIEALLEP